MKKIIIFFIAILLSFILFFAYINKIKFIKLNSTIYYNKALIYKNENNSWCAWFKIAGQNWGNYEETMYCASCDENQILSVVQTKKYKFNIPIENNINNSTVSAQFDAFLDGDIYYKAICNNKN